MLSWHNQTVNIWTSMVLAGFNIFLCDWFSQDHNNIPASILALFWIHGLLRAFCWFNSWAYHTFNCHSKEWASFLVTMDYIGCYLTPLGMGTNAVFIELYCFQSIAITILVCGVVCIVGAIYTALSPRYQTERYRSLRLWLSVGSMVPYLIGLAVAICIVHKFNVPSYYVYMLYAFSCELVGAFFYTSMLPERVYPKAFDSLLSSHSLWHWCNFGFDFFMIYFAYGALTDLQRRNFC
jgi:adiponectin receptor